MTQPTRSKAAKAEELRISQIGDFKNRIGGIRELPSGLVVKFRNPGGLQAFMGSGSIPNSLMPIIKQALNTGKAPDAKELLSPDGEFDADLLQDMMTMFDGIALACIVEPKIHPKPATEAERSDEMLYVDELPLEDKQYLMALVQGGVKDLESFRKQQDEHVVDVAKKQVSVRDAQRAAGLDPR